ncbi:hypothetical protein NFJ02_13g15250 [Pycnococcus provasolii]
MSSPPPSTQTQTLKTTLRRLLRSLADKDVCERALASLKQMVEDVLSSADSARLASLILRECLVEFREAPPWARRGRLRAAAYCVRRAPYSFVAPAVAGALRFAASNLTERDRGACADLRELVAALSAAVASHAGHTPRTASPQDGAALLATLLVDPLVRGVAAAVDPDAKALGVRCVAAAVYECALAAEQNAAPLALSALAATLAATGESKPGTAPPAHGEAASLAALSLSVVADETAAPAAVVHAVARLAAAAVSHRGDYRVREKGAAAARALADHAGRHEEVAASLAIDAHALGSALSAARFDKVRRVREGVLRATDALRHVIGDAVDACFGSPSAGEARVPLGVAERRRTDGGGRASPSVEIYVPGHDAPVDAEAMPEMVPPKVGDRMRAMEARAAVLAAGAASPTKQRRRRSRSRAAAATATATASTAAAAKVAAAVASANPKGNPLVARAEDSLMQLAEASLFERLEGALPGLGMQGRLEPALRQLLRAQIADLASFYRRKCGERIEARVAEYRAAVQKLRSDLQRDVRDIHTATNVAIDAEVRVFAKEQLPKIAEMLMPRRAADGAAGAAAPPPTRNETPPPTRNETPPPPVQAKDEKGDDDDDKEEKIVTKEMGAVSTPVQNALGEWVEDDEQREQKAPKSPLDAAKQDSAFVADYRATLSASSSKKTSASQEEEQ